MTRPLLLLCEYPTLNGGEQSLLATLPLILNSGLLVRAIAPPIGPLANALTARGVEVIPFICHGQDGVRLSQAELRARLEEQLRQQAPALLHANSLSMARLSGPVAASLNLPSIGHLRDIIKLSKAAVTDINAHTRLLAVSEATRTFHVAQGLDASRTLVNYNGVDTTRFCPSQATGWLHAELQLPTTARLIGCIGQIVLRKGQDVLAHAAQLLAAEFPDLHYVIVGERYSEKDEAIAFEQQLQTLFPACTDGPRVHFLGVRSQLERLLPELTLLVHPARQEPLGRVLLEAAASAVPVVATTVGGTAEIFSVSSDTAAQAEATAPPKVSALLVPPNDVAALANAMRQVLNDPAAAATRAQTARTRIETQFNTTVAAHSLLNHYHAVMDGSTR